jgi:prepilin-type N-terminal cleavage/methylation domain-containing protein
MLRHKIRQYGFTLAELLISLAILGLLSAFLIPKVIQANEVSVRKAVLKETIATLSQVVAQAAFENVSYSAIETYILSHLNATKICPNNISTEGCTTTMLSYASGFKGANLPNGATIALRADTTDIGIVYLLVDYNGDSLPNTFSTSGKFEDIALLTGNYTNQDKIQSGCWSSSYVRRRQTLTIECQEWDSDGAWSELWR